MGICCILDNIIPQYDILVALVGFLFIVTNKTPIANNVYCQCLMLTVCTKGLRVTQFQFSVCMYCTCGRIDNKARLDLTWLDLKLSSDGPGPLLVNNMALRFCQGDFHNIFTSDLPEPGNCVIKFDLFPILKLFLPSQPLENVHLQMFLHQIQAQFGQSTSIC